MSPVDGTHLLTVTGAALARALAPAQGLGN